MAEQHLKDLSYSETQRFRQTWLWIIIVIVAWAAWFGALNQLLLHRPFGDHPLPNSLLFICWLLLGNLFPALVLLSNLLTEVRADGICIRFTPFHFSERKFSFADLLRCEPKTYSPIKEYGGWGIRYGKNGKAYNVYGNRGVHLEFHDGRQMLIGSQKPEKLARAVQQGLAEYRARHQII